MRLLLDTHAFLWWLAGDEQLSPSARRAIADQDNDVFVSAASAWEIATKYRIGKLPAVTAIVADIDRVLLDRKFRWPSHQHPTWASRGALPGPHRDPFDRMLIAQAMLDDLTLVSNELAFDAYGVRRLW